MSLWHASLGLCFVALGAWATWRDGRLLLSRTARRRSRRDPARARYARRKGSRGLLLAFLCLVIGVGWLTGWNTHWFYVWLMVALLVLLLSWDLSAKLRSRRKDKPSVQPAGNP